MISFREMHLVPKWVAAGMLSAATLASAETYLRLVNHQPFPVHQPVEIRHLQLTNGPWRADESEPVQASGSNLVMIARLEPADQREVNLRPGDAKVNAALTVRPGGDGLQLTCRRTDLGRLTWDIVLRVVKKSDSGKPGDFETGYRPLPLVFARTASGPVFDTWTTEATKSGLKLGLEARVFHEGFVDLKARLMNESAKNDTNVYCAVVCRWEQPRVQSRSLSYDNHVRQLGNNDRSTFRQGEGRHLFLQRGVDWIRTRFRAGITAAWLNDFAPSFTLLAPATARTPERYTGANLPQLGQEIQTTRGKLYSITEIARSSIQSLRDRLKENVLPPAGEGVAFASRLIIADSTLGDEQSDQAFVAWTSYNEQKTVEGRHEVSFGVEAVRFGTSYFPYSTLGENFDRLKLPGMDRESFWPLAADTVNQWRLFADDIRRDLRIAKFMGFQLIRLHHLELLAPIEESVRREYLDFLFGELRHLQLKAMLDVYSTPEQIAQLVKRYGDVVDSVEIENEVLIWGIPVDRPAYWNSVYDAVKKAAPHVKVHLTGYNNTGIFDRLERLGVKFDRVGLHAYLDTPEAIPSGRGYALAAASYGNRSGKAPVITEWNWRGLTRMTSEARSNLYPQIIEGAVGTRGLQDFYQFQFNETLAPNPRIGRGNILRHYELLHLSRRPKPEAFALMELIRNYSGKDELNTTVEVPQAISVLDSRGEGWAKLKVTNTGQSEVRLHAIVESMGRLKADIKGSSEIVLKPGQARSVAVGLKALSRATGFYHAFLRLETDQGKLRYGWIEARMAGALKLGPAPKAEASTLPARSEPSRLDWSKISAVVYGSNAPVLEVETATAIAETLESAVGRPVEALQYENQAWLQATNIVLVGTVESNELIAECRLRGQEGATAESPAGKLWPIVTGTDSREVENAGMEFILRYWTLAKDSAARRVGLVEKELPRGVDAVKLP